jgi:hypothetical protein
MRTGIVNVPGRAKVETPAPAVISFFLPVISKRSEKSHDAEDAFLGADDDCMRSLPTVEMTAGEGRDDSGPSPCPVGSIAL